MSVGAQIGMNFINKGIDQFNYGVSQEYNRYAREKSRKWQVQDMKSGLQWRAQDAIKAYEKSGIHPLALLGSGGVQSAPISAGGSSPPSGGGSSIDFHGNETRELLREQIKQARIDTEYKQLELDAKKAGQNVTPPATTNPTPFNIANGDLNSDGLIDNVGPFDQQNMDSQGRVWQTPSQQLQEAVSDEAPWSTQLKYQWSVLSDQGKAWLVKKFPKQATQGNGELAIFYDQWIKTRPQQEGYVFLWDTLYGWRRFRKQDVANPKALFLDNSGKYRSNRNIPKAKTKKSIYKEFPGYGK